MEACLLELVEVGGPAAEPAQLGAGSVEERVEGESPSFDAGDLDDLVDPAGQEASLAGAEAARPVAVDDEVDVAHPVERLLGLDAGAGGEREADEVSEGVLGRLAVHAGHARVAGRERPEHRHRLGAAALADEDPVGVHPQRVGDEVLERDCREAVGARRPRLVADAVGEQARQLQLGRGLADDDPFGAGDRAAERVQERRLAGGDAAGDDDVLAGADAGGEEVGGLVAQEAEPDELVERAGGEPEAADRADRVPFEETGGIAAVRREPSGRRASTRGVIRSSRFPSTCSSSRSTNARTWRSSSKTRSGTRSIRSPVSRKRRFGPLIIHSCASGSASIRSAIAPEPDQLVRAARRRSSLALVGSRAAAPAR